MGKPSYKAMALSCLCNALRTDSDPSVRCAIAEALGKIGGIEATKALCTALEYDQSPQVRQVIAGELARIRRGSHISSDSSVHINGGSYYESININGGNYIQGNYLDMSQDLTQSEEEDPI